MLTIIDNYDSFTYNLVHYLGELGAESRVYRNDSVPTKAILAESPSAIVLSPGPKDPDHAGICLKMVRLAAGLIPTFGVCLGHQTIAQSFGAKIVRASHPMHGKRSRIHHDGTGVFQGLPNDFEATRYHSLTVDRASLPAQLRVNAETEDGVVMGIAHKTFTIHGVQFHPESIASELGHAVLANFLKLAAIPVTGEIPGMPAPPLAAPPNVRRLGQRA
jgi:anthranilate synthase component 2